jgi:hypothetical protein
MARRVLSKGGVVLIWRLVMARRETNSDTAKDLPAVWFNNAGLGMESRFIPQLKM